MQTLVKGLKRPSSEQDIRVKKTIQPVKKGESANIEAQKGEVALGNWMHDGLPEMYVIGGLPHSQGGTDLNVPDNSFIFSKEKSLAVKGEDILKKFGKKDKASGYDPAELAKQYDINKYRKILAEPNSDRIQRETAERMIKNYNNKLGALALTQESMKGFPDGIPFVSVPYLNDMGIDPATLVHGSGKDEAEVPTQSEENDNPVAKMGGSFKIKITGVPEFQDGGQPKKGGPKKEEPVANPNETEWMSKYTDLEKSYTDNKGIQKAVYEQYKKDHPDTKLSEAQVNNYLITLQRHNYKLQSAYDKKSSDLNTGDWDKGKNSDKYRKEIKALGEEPLTAEQIKIAQGGYRALVRLQNDPNQADFFNKYGLKEFGPKKANHQLAGRNVSSEDGLVGSDTLNQLLYPIESKQTAVINDKQKQNPLKDLKKEKELDPRVASTDNPFWTEDLIKMAGAAGDYARIKKYMPWKAGYETVLPNAVYADPTRELAANSEQANIAEMNLGAFAGPQALSARMSDVQGKSLSNAADILNRYNNLNVGVANNLENTRTGIINADSQRRSDRTTELYDQSVIANQQFDNAKNQAREKMRESFIQAWTNRGKTQGLNSINKQYRVDPRTGYVNFTGVPGVVDPEKQRQDILDYYNTIMENPNIQSNSKHAEILLNMYAKGLGVQPENNIPQNIYP